MCFRKLFGFSGALGAPNHYVQKTCVSIGVLARRGHWGSKTLCFQRFSGSSEAVGAPLLTPFFLFPELPWKLQNPFVFRGVLAPKSFVFFIGCWILGGPGNFKNLCFHNFSGSSGGLGGCKHCLFTSILAPRGPWGSKTLCPRCSGSSGALGAPKSCVSQVFGLLR